ncbi:hypothetical protein PROFUN_15829 [Planoprotostelium fungivorum]|uniref:ABC transporter domain-containing protein n=1 Tax=Planoprotostelium fungivorum TaxID=1890364 RepID=A0A2P6MTC1_9EUKA|nr:hypothetical protein PROFUN_15829 [Planoprotostelium fungivorum]
MTTPPGVEHLRMSKNIHQDVEKPRPPPGFAGHEAPWAMTFKNATLTIRQPVTLFCQTILPLLLLTTMFLPQIIIKITGMSETDNDVSNSLSLRTFYVGDVVHPDLYYGSREWSSSNCFGFSVDSRDSNGRKLPIGFVNGTNGDGWLSHTIRYFYSVENYYVDPNEEDNIVPRVFPTNHTMKDLLSQMIVDKNELTRSENSGRYRNTNIPRYVLDFKKLTEQEMDVNVLTQQSEGTEIFSGEPFNSANQMITWAGILFSTGVNARDNRNASDPSFSVLVSSGYYAVLRSKNNLSYMSSTLIVTILPLAASFLPILIVQIIVSEKQSRAMEMMKIMGMSVHAYWFSTWAYFFAIGLVIYTIMLVMLLSFKTAAFMESNPAVYIILLVLYAAVQSSYGIFISNLFQRQKVATLVMYLVTFFIVPVGATLCIAFFAYDAAPVWFMLYPPWAFSRGVYLLTMYFLLPGVSKQSFSVAMEGEMLHVWLWLLGETIVLSALTSYMERVWPKEHGIAESPLFPFYTLMRWFRGSKSGETMPLLSGEHDAPSTDAIVVVRELKKHFGKKKALDGLSLDIQAGECLGLLGPNGAGKSTLAHILCGLSEPTSGTAFVAGHDIKYDMPGVRTVLGFCPQHEIVWEDLTVEEHLLFYLRLKSVPSKWVAYECDRVLGSVGLYYDKNKKSTQLSGGMKRRLSIAISLVGNPKCLILVTLFKLKFGAHTRQDEPTTGLDPDTRRSIWDMVQSQREGRAIILTTHNMEEADVLSSRIAIVSRGNLVCIGSQMDLKRQYGRGYKLSISPRLDCSERAKAYVLSLFPTATVDTISVGTINFYIPTTDVDVSSLFSEMMKNKDENGIIEWGVSQASLEEVFIKVVEKDEADEQINKT